MGMLRMRDWAGCVLFLLICSPPSAPRFPFPSLSCSALPCLPCLPASLPVCSGSWNFQVGRERDQFASGPSGRRPATVGVCRGSLPGVPVAAGAGMKNWESSGLQTPCAGTRANPLQVIVSHQSGFGKGSKERGTA